MNRTFLHISCKEHKWNKLLFWFSFFMAFPSILMFGQNISIFIFAIMMLFLIRYKRGSVFKLTNSIQWFAVLFGIAAVLSVANIPTDAASNSLERALSVLPNYLYWSFLIILLVTNRQIIFLEVIYKGISWGVVVTCIYYLFLQRTLIALPVFNPQSPNNFAFILICYTPFVVYYLLQTKGKTWAITFLVILVLIMLRDGRRAGMVLVLFGGLAVLFAGNVNWRNVLSIVIIIAGMLILKSTQFVEQFILISSERIHEMLYESENIKTKDRSYLTRVAMMNKGLAIAKKYPYTGIGLNNFSNYSIDFDKSFDGAKYVVHKENLHKRSAHNSYISLFAEGGIFLLGTFLLLLSSCILYALKNYVSIPPNVRPLYIGLFAMSVHLYFISAIVNVFAWYLIGLACAFMYRK